MFLRLNDHDYIKIGFFDNVGGETNVQRITHRFAQDNLGHSVNSTICIDEQELRSNQRHCPLCSKYIELKKQSITKEDIKKAEKYKSEPYYTAIVYNYDTKKIQILQYTASIFEELDRFRRMYGGITEFVFGIKNNHGFNNPDKKWYVVQRLEKVAPLDKIVLTDEIKGYFEKLTTPLSFNELESRVRGEIKIVESSGDNCVI
jgi:hypothetical protein